MNDLYYNFYYPVYERINFSTDDPIAKLGFWFLKPGRAVFWKKVEVFDKDNILSVRTIENPIKYPIFAVALRIILWIPTFLGILFLELAWARTPWQQIKPYVMDILDHDKWESLEEREITASKIRRLLTLGGMWKLANELSREYEKNQDKRVGLKIAFIGEVTRRYFSPWYGIGVDLEVEFGRLKFASMSEEAAIKYAPLCPFPYVKVLCKFPLHCRESILNQLMFDKKIAYLLCDDFIDFIPRDSCESLVKIVSERFADYMINHRSLTTVIDKFKESICSSIDLGWIFAEEHDSLLKNLLNHIRDDEKNKKWIFNLAQSAFYHNKDLKLFSLLSGKQIFLIYLFPSHLKCRSKRFDPDEIAQIKWASFNLILQFKEIRSKLTPSDFKRICDGMLSIYKNYFNNKLWLGRKDRYKFLFSPCDGDKDRKDGYKFLFSPCGEDIESLRNIPCSLLKSYLNGVKCYYIKKLCRKLSPICHLSWIELMEMRELQGVFQLHPIPPEVQEKIQSLGSGIQEIIQKKRNEYLEHFNKILYLDELVFLKIYHGILTNEEKAYILELSREEPEKGSTYLPTSLRIMCAKFLHENPESMKQEKCNDGMLALIDAYKSLSL